MAKVLTAAFVEKVRPTETRREIADGGLTGLFLIVQPSGKKSWACRYRHHRRSRKYTIGTYPIFSLAEAREAARKVLREASEGLDPAARKRAAASTDLMFEVVSQEFLKNHAYAKRSESYARETERLLAREVIPKWGKRQISEITPDDVEDILTSIVDRGAGILANRTLAALRKLFNWAATPPRRYVASNPCAGFARPASEVSRDRVLSDIELRALWNAIVSLPPHFAGFARMLILTGQRRAEVANMRWCEIDGKVWTIPGARTKNGKAHLVPLSKMALDSLVAVPHTQNKGDFIFCTNGRSPISGFSKMKRQVDVAMAAELQDLEPWRLHDLRRTVASGMARLKIPQPVVDKHLNHKGGAVSGVSAVYNRHEYFGERSVAVDAWAQHVEGLISGFQDNVLKMSDGRR